MGLKDTFVRFVDRISSDSELSPYSAEIVRSITNELIDLALLHNDYTKTFVLNVHLSPALYAKISDIPLYITKLSQLSNKKLTTQGTRLEVENIRVIEDRHAKSNFRITLDDQSILEKTQNLAANAEQQLQSFGFLMLVDGDNFELTQQITNIGRDEKNNLVLADPHVSRDHCQIRLIKGNIWIFDKNSNSGTKVNNELISQKILHPGDVIHVGRTDLIFGIDDDESSETAKMLQGN